MCVGFARRNWIRRGQSILKEDTMSIEIDHMSLSVGGYDMAKAFYAAALKPLRGGVLMEFPMDDGNKVMGLGSDGKPFLWISGNGKVPHVHIALRAETRDQVDAFYKAAMAAGGTDNGAPGLRPRYHKNYYAAFVIDPEGHNIECVTHTAPAAAKRRASSRKAGAKRASAAETPAKRGAAKRASAAKKPAERAAAKKPTRKAATKPAARRAAGRKPARRSTGKKTRR
jgi:catechol 2,3-dioxygenase-like lactoylglutathione lyase family enzyme